MSKGIHRCAGTGSRGEVEGTTVGLVSGDPSCLTDLPVASEVRTGYDRDLFTLGVDADGDGCNTRHEVMIAEAEERPSVGSGCALTGERWFSYYDGVSQHTPGRSRHRPHGAARRGMGVR
ncbi:hypothetical protein GCM10023350_21030 [Nocardioides endophyticus]|uniref:Uncharacterized protein n=1 Tax=Nocardioides endophyticus TaxID=1353775 RepID=A0ABP8YT32_9ACTN